MKAAMRDAETSLSEIDYIHLHGTGTVDNDLSEAKALKKLFGENTPPISSVKGVLGHSLAAAGAIGAEVCALGIKDGVIPPSTGFRETDPELGLKPASKPIRKDVRIALCNSFGFGGANSSLLIGKADAKAPDSFRKLSPLSIAGNSLISGAGGIDKTIERITTGDDCRGLATMAEIVKPLDLRAVRRLQRLPRMALSLAVGAAEGRKKTGSPSAVFWGTGWGPLSETHNFLKKLFDSGERFSSPIDFIGSVHNSPAGQIAMHFKAEGPNVTLTGGDYSFEQALLAAQLLSEDIPGPCLVLAADEHHSFFSPLFEPAAAENGVFSDGGGALYLEKNQNSLNPKIFLSFLERGENRQEVISALTDKLGGPEIISERFGAVMAGLPGAFRKVSEEQLKQFIEIIGFDAPMIDYRKIIGEFASASAVAASISSFFKKTGEIPAALCNGKSILLNQKGILVLGLGKYVSAIEIT
jgi:3-oxoacyl-[acyl-carrier-protein] synthase-1/3-oxoacyl-[acyl-carrier-protein] synthase II